MGQDMITLTGLEILHLARCAGFAVAECDEKELLEGEHYIARCPESGVQNDDGEIEHFDYVATCDGCDAGECTPLGKPIVAPATDADISADGAEATG